MNFTTSSTTIAAYSANFVVTYTTPPTQGPDAAGVREPRRPRPDEGTDAMALTLEVPCR